MTKGSSLLRHARTVELVMEAYAKKYNEDPEEWAVTGMLHDADYEKYPEDHPNRIVELLREKGEEKIAHAISAHYTKWNVSYDTLLDKALLACDELTGFIVACSQVRPEGISTLTAKSVKKKLKQVSFAAKVERDEIAKGVELMGFDLTDHITFIIEVLKEHKEELGI
ncbi:MAG: HD domain-containing protein [Bacteroidota bacterium]